MPFELGLLIMLAVFATFFYVPLKHVIMIKRRDAELSKFLGEWEEEDPSASESKSISINWGRLSFDYKNHDVQSYDLISPSKAIANLENGSFFVLEMVSPHRLVIDSEHFKGTFSRISSPA